MGIKGIFPYTSGSLINPTQVCGDSLKEQKGGDTSSTCMPHFNVSTLHATAGSGLHAYVSPLQVTT